MQLSGDLAGHLPQPQSCHGRCKLSFKKAHRAQALWARGEGISTELQKENPNLHRAYFIIFSYHSLSWVDTNFMFMAITQQQQGRVLNRQRPIQCAQAKEPERWIPGAGTVPSLPTPQHRSSQRGGPRQ